jgi:hypothetical protein
LPARYSRATDERTERTNMRDNESVYLMPICVWRTFLRAHLHDVVVVALGPK